MAKESIICGIHAVTAALTNHPEKIVVIFCQKETKNSRLESVLALAKENEFKIQFVQEAKLAKMAGSSHHQGIVANLRETSEFDEKALIALVKEKEERVLLLVLEGVQDPHNLGACLRSAEALGVDAVILPKDNAAPLNATVSKAACGAAETLKIAQVSNIVRCLENLQSEGVWIIGTSDKAKKGISEVKLPRRLAIAMGSEGTGLKRLTLESCDEVVKIPLEGTVNSLNVSVATGICLYEYCRQVK